MGIIKELDQGTINQIAAGEVVERPSSIVKELLENSIDAGATRISVEIEEGGTKSIRITDNGKGINKEDIRIAFLRHTTSKIKTAMDLLTVSSLGFRGEALSSIAAVCQVELLTRTADAMEGIRYRIEGGKEVVEQIRAIVNASIPVVAHLGLTPQSINAFGGFKVQGKSEEAAQRLLEEARAVEEAGAFAVVLECVPAKLAEFISKEISIPTIGIGAGAGCDGQVLVYQDMLGMYSDFVPKFAKQYAKVGEVMRKAFADYNKEVKDGVFPEEKHTFKIDEEVIEKLY